MNEWIVKVFDAQNRGAIGIDIVIMRRVENGTQILSSEGVITTIERGMSFGKPTLYLDRDMLKPFADALQEFGVRPTEAGKTEGYLEAQTEHMKTLTKIFEAVIKNPRLLDLP